MHMCHITEQTNQDPETEKHERNVNNSPKFPEKALAGFLVVSVHGLLAKALDVRDVGADALDDLGDEVHVAEERVLRELLVADVEAGVVGRLASSGGYKRHVSRVEDWGVRMRETYLPTRCAHPP